MLVVMMSFGDFREPRRNSLMLSIVPISKLLRTVASLKVPKCSRSFAPVVLDGPDDRSLWCRESLNILHLLFDPIDRALDHHDGTAHFHIVGFAGDRISFAQHFLSEKIEGATCGVGIV